MEAEVAAALKGHGGLAKAVDDFEAGPSDEEEPGSGSDGGGSSSFSEGEEEAGEEAGSSGQEDEDDFGSDDGVEDGMPGSSGGEEVEEGGSGGGDSDAEPSGGQQDQDKVGFLEGGKAASFAKAFARIVETSGKKAEVIAGAAGGAGPAAAPILAVSKSIAKRKVDQAAEEKQDRAAKKLRMEMKQRGHIVPKRRGQDPTSDAKDKALQRLATKGVVRLFNAIAKAQKQLREAEEATGSRAKAVKLGKASFLAQLKSSGAAAAAEAGGRQDQLLVPSAPSRQSAAPAAAAAAAGGSKKQQTRRQAAAAAEDSSEDEDAGGWDVLKQGFVGLQGGSKMKDWDKQESDDEPAGDQLDGMGGSSDDDN